MDKKALSSSYRLGAPNNTVATRLFRELLASDIVCQAWSVYLLQEGMDSCLASMEREAWVTPSGDGEREESREEVGMDTQIPSKEKRRKV